MEVIKTSEKYNFYKEGEKYILDLGKKKRAEDTPTEFLISGLEDSKLFSIKGSCGCVTTKIEVIDQNTIKASIRYTECESKIVKFAVLKYQGVRINEIKIIGTCSN